MKKETKEKKLTKEEFLELELRHAQSDLINREKVILDLKKELMGTKKTLLVYMNKDIDKDILDLDKVSQSLDNKAEKGKKDREILINKVKKRLKIKGRFGYDPDKLIVIEE